ncbi:MAG: RNA pyrophosphohydrolase [Chlamydiia bacterium]|nr:RNA pyrophosphohydrolase [Chlamydiia bacterium]
MEDHFHLGVKGIITNSSGEVLVLEKHPNKRCGTVWDLPGGRIHKGETLEQALKREVFEETGLQNLTNIKFLLMDLVNFRIPVAQSDVGLIFAVHQCKLEQIETITLSDEHTSYKWMSPSKAANLLKASYPRRVINLLSASPCYEKP